MSQAEVKPIPPAQISFNLRQREREEVPYPEAEIKERTRLQCRHCKELRPFDQFKSGTDPLCEDCRSEANELELKEIKDKNVEKFSRTLTEATRGKEVRLDSLRSICGEMLHLWGGYKGFAQSWHSNIVHAIEKNPGGKNVLDAHSSFAKLLFSLQKQEHVEHITDLTDQQLRSAKELAMMHALLEMGADPGHRQMMIGLLNSEGGSIIDGAVVEEEVDGTDQE